MGSEMCIRDRDRLDNARDLAQRVITIPFYENMSYENMCKVLEAITAKK